MRLANKYQGVKANHYNDLKDRASTARRLRIAPGQLSRCQSVCKRNEAAALTSFPLSYFVPRATFSTRYGALSFRKLVSATIIVFQIKQVALTCDLNRLEAVVPQPDPRERRFHDVGSPQVFPVLSGKVIVRR